MGKTFSIKVLFGIYLLLMAGKVFAFSCNVDGGSSIGAGTTSVYVNLDPVILPGQNLVVDLSQHISCWNDYGGWYDTDHINLVQGSAFAGSLQSYKGSLYWNNVTYPFPLTTNTNVLDIGDKTPMPLPLKLYITPVGAAGGVVIKSGEVIARIHMYKIATLGSGNPRNFTWNIISNNSVVMPTGGCTVDSRNVTVNDRYRGVFGQRDVVFMSAKQAKICRVKNGERVNLIALTPDGKRSSRRMDRLKVVIYPMADRSLVTYFPESNHMLTLDNHDPLSGIPGYKSIPVELEPSN